MKFLILKAPSAPVASPNQYVCNNDIGYCPTNCYGRMCSHCKCNIKWW